MSNRVSTDKSTKATHRDGDDRKFFVGFAALLGFLVLAGFVPSSMARIDAGSFESVHILHGVTFLLWYMLFFSQALLIRNGNVKLHMTIGSVSIFLVVAMVVTGALVMQKAWLDGTTGDPSMTPAQFIVFPFSDLLLFSFFYGMAILFRKKADVHKRFIVFAGLLMMGAALSRVVDTLGLSPQLVGPLVLALFIILVVYDWRTLRRVHPVTIIGFVLLILRVVAAFTLAASPEWEAFVSWMLGPYTGAPHIIS